MRTSFSLIALVLVSCGDAGKKPDGPPDVAVAPRPLPSVSPTQAPPSPPSQPARPAPGTKVTVATKSVDDSWDKILVVDRTMFVLTDVNKWSSGPMYVPAARLWSAPVGGGEMTKHLDLEGLASLASDGDDVYVAVVRDLSTMGTPRANGATGRIFRMPQGGGAPVNLATGIAPSVFAIDGETLWFDGFRMPKNGSSPPRATGFKAPLAFAFDDENVYFTGGKGSAGPVKSGGKNGAIFRASKAGGAPTVIARGLPDEPSGLAVDGTHVYVAAVAWGSEAAENGGIVARVPKSGGDLEVLARDQPLVRTAWLVGDHVYVRSGRPGRPGAILRVPKGGGNVATVLTDPTLVSATTDGTSIFFSNDGTFRKEPFERLTKASVVRFFL